MGAFRQTIVQILGLAFFCANVSAKTFFYSHDHLGSTSLVSDISGIVVQKEETTPFGETLVSLRNSQGLSYLYTDQEKDQSSDLYSYGARYYDAAGSRFVSVDPEWDGPNPYGYTQNNPILFNDPSGRVAQSTEPSSFYLSPHAKDLLARTAESFVDAYNKVLFAWDLLNAAQGGPPAGPLPQPVCLGCRLGRAQALPWLTPRPTPHWNQSFQEDPGGSEEASAPLTPETQKAVRKNKFRCVNGVNWKAMAPEYQGRPHQFAVVERTEGGIKYAHTVFLHLDPETGVWMADERLNSLSDKITFFGQRPFQPWDEAKALWQEAYGGSIRIELFDLERLESETLQALQEYADGARGIDGEWSKFQGVLEARGLFYSPPRP